MTVDPAKKLALLRRMAEAWRAGGTRLSAQPPDRAAPWMLDNSFEECFAAHWRMLPTREAQDLARMMAARIMHGPDFPVSADLDPERQFQFRSGGQYRLFGLLAVLRATDARLAGQLVQSHAELKVAAGYFPQEGRRWMLLGRNGALRLRRMDGPEE